MKHALASLNLSLNFSEPRLSQQLVEQIKTAVQSGRLNTGDKLPASRALALSLGVSRSTTLNAYEQLIAEGVLYSEAKRGVFVAQNVSFAHTAVKLPNVVSEPEPVLRFDSGVDATVFPAKEWARSMRRSWLKPDLKLLQGGYPTGFPALKVALADYLYRVRGLVCSPEQIVITAGNRDALIILQHTLARIAPQAQWWLEAPCYPPMQSVLADKAQGLHYLQVDQEGACLPALSAAPYGQVAITTPNRQYPLGISMSSARRQLWLQALQHSETPLWLIEDDYDNEFIYQGRSGLPLMQADLSERVFFLGSFSKVLFRGLRLGFIVAPKSQVSQLCASQKALGASASLPMQPVVTDFMLQGSFDRHLNRMRRHYRLRRDYLLSLLEQNLTPWFDWQKPTGGMHIILRFKAELLAQTTGQLLDQQIARQLEQIRVSGAKIQLSVLSAHYPAQNATAVDFQIGQGFVLGFSATDERNMLLLIEQLKQVMLNLRLECTGV
ncbi:transcriptional regulator, GntR family [Oceanospirillum multiglobuliferum]|uniref:HTH gntR-type domain-containing protein n=1 Tax=Oceanospirillum multiglobuliferum TaxID=64969 RepID=A0A1T4Q3I2_9GAMM|nr:PLP-dependent aminotransferase family protein [Oceanospirillum multiglobuliferum]OPX55503.1 hypothetical protein BTE48_08955 [Oceanospirillum multiglobuliferum]SJZ98299.1 transcriptional regulator, GntR family [Oceanospirillum multiglobuliferum]